MKHALKMLCCIAMALPTQVAAQRAQLPATAEAGRLERAIEAPQKAKSTPSTASTETGARRTITVPENADKLTFTLKHIAIEGMTRYEEQAVLAPYADLKGKTITVARIYAIASDILNRYSEDGYAFVLVYLPPQKITDGAVTIKVTEGFVNRIELSGIKESPAIREAMDTLRAERPLSSALLEEQMLLLNDLAGIQMRAVVEPDKESKQEGALKLRWIATQDRVDGFVSANNHGSRYNGPAQTLGAISVNNLTGRNDKTSLNTLATVPFSEARYHSIEHRQQIGLRTSLGVQLNRSRNAPGYTLEPQEVRGKTRGITVDAQYKAIRSRRENLDVLASFSATDYRTDILSTRLYEDKLRVARVGAVYDTVDQWNGTSSLGLTVSQGLDILGVRETGSFELSRQEGHSDFTKLELTAWHLHPLGSGWSLYGLAMGQLASDPLLASEEFGFGGSVVGRAFDVAELTGDHGISGTVEMRYIGIEPWYSIRPQPFAFYDMGTVWNLDTNGERESAAAWGLGVRALIDEKAQVSATIGWPLKHRPEAPQYGNATNPRIGVSLTVPF